MGLDAVVFRNIHSLETAFGAGRFCVDGSTGEASLKSDGGVRIPRSAYFAAKRRIGNADEVGWLRATAKGILGPGNWLIVDRILYSGSHSGDSIPVGELPQLRKEIDVLKSRCGDPLKAFIEAIELLLEAAEVEGGPIVFV